MTNELLKAAESSDDESSEDRYNKLKKEEADTESTSPAKQRYDELKEKAKREFERQELEKKRKEAEEDDDSEAEDDEQFITY
ncbi:hypothetical protein [Candidatus Nanohalovita haloferacivicina]|uniref:hypothetical protein n=1 Tax=Candidatus Nanohalovita haloferacivicina TaxID=2978046 RepID=UPI00325FB18C|nr:hypothetical protein HBNXNv_0894 [Candidatus Nanohalobia archaeon BNXNv]